MTQPQLGRLRLTALHAMPVDMEQEGAQRVSAPVTVRSASTLLGRLLLVQHRLIASRVRLEDMEQVVLEYKQQL